MVPEEPAPADPDRPPAPPAADEGDRDGGHEPPYHCPLRTEDPELFGALLRAEASVRAWGGSCQDFWLPMVLAAILPQVVEGEDLGLPAFPTALAALFWGGVGVFLLYVRSVLGTRLRYSMLRHDLHDRIRASGRTVERFLTEVEGDLAVDRIARCLKRDPEGPI